MRNLIPPGGAAGFVQMTPASRLALTRGTAGSRSGSGGPRRKRRTAKRARRAAPARARKAGGRKLKFGSPAWQRKYKVGKFRK